MQDRFKFRFWDKETQTMQKIPMVELRHRITLDKIFADDRVIFMQCTGLKDKNGKLIYEGDVLKINTHFDFLVPDDFEYKYESEKGYSLFKVYYNEEFARYEMKRIKWVKWETEHKRLCNIHTNHIIIGNIYENAELLEE